MWATSRAGAGGPRGVSGQPGAGAWEAGREPEGRPGRTGASGGEGSAAGGEPGGPSDGGLGEPMYPSATREDLGDRGEGGVVAELVEAASELTF